MDWLVVLLDLLVLVPDQQMMVNGDGDGDVWGRGCSHFQIRTLWGRTRGKLTA